MRGDWCATTFVLVVLPTSPTSRLWSVPRLRGRLERSALESLGFVGQAVLESLGEGSVGVLEYWTIEFTANLAFMALIYEMAIADVHDTITARSQVLVMGYYHQSFLFLTD